MGGLILECLRTKCSSKVHSIWEISTILFVIFSIFLQIYPSFALQTDVCGDVNCSHGGCKEGRCICDRGWQGVSCQRCGGRVRLTSPTGVITDGIGNYSVDMQCTWLVDSGYDNASIRLQVINFETECSWDHLYIFDGDSIYSPLVAAFSGVFPKTQQDIPEVVTSSGKAFVYFYSDAAYNMSGFNITYRMNGCPKNCSERGKCVKGVCFCPPRWRGESCHIPECPEGCNHGHCDSIHGRCICNPSYTGLDCSIPKKHGWWEEITPLGPPINGRSLHQSVLIDRHMWVFGGETLFHQAPFLSVARYEFDSNTWIEVEIPSSSVQPANRFGHSAIVYQDKVYMYGGILSNGSVVSELWTFNGLEWNLLPATNGVECVTEMCTPLEVMGHSATLVENIMVVIFGHSPLYGYLNSVQYFNLTSERWELIHTKGAIVKGGCGHSSAYDKLTQKIYVYGGYHSFGPEAALVDFLYAYDPWDKFWVLLTPSQSQRYLHSVSILSGLMLVFGGNTHNGTLYSNGDRCFSPEILAYDIVFNTWQVLTFPAASNIGRFGHSAVSYNGSLWIYGGFNGELLSDIQKFTPGSCDTVTEKTLCEKINPGIKCSWNTDLEICSKFSEHKSLIIDHPISRVGVNVTLLCNLITSCPSCIENSYGCVWCAGSCQPQSNCDPRSKKVTQSDQCDQAESSNCDMLHNCNACHTEYHCGWQKDDKCYTFVREMGNGTSEKAILSDSYRARCEVPCSSRTTCENCTEGPCMWCSSEGGRCIESNAYAAIFPMGRCMEWTTQAWKCNSLACSSLQTCDQCQKNPYCGWCDFGLGTGLGACMEGGDTGPLRSLSCPASKDWFFTTCPKCQCNGHNTCLNNTDICLQPCNHLTEGSQCQQCMAGYYGNSVNGGNCTQCFCNSHGDLCNRETGACYCTTKGITGKHCNRCDETNHYIGNPTLEGGSCFYNLSIDFQYTFNMSKLEDRYFTNINFMNVPLKQDVDVDFTLTCSDSAMANITVASSSTGEKVLQEFQKCGSFKMRFSHSEHTFGVDNTTFYVYVFSFNTPLVIQISFSQHRTLDLLQFFITFSSCFLSLLIIAAGLWKVKQKYDGYRRRQRMFVEMEQMASRPFASVTVDVTREFSPLGDEESLKKIHPTPVALEPCAGGRAAILSLILILPSGENSLTPAGQSGLAIASALVSLGTLCKSDSGKPVNKDSWKAAQTGTCI